MTVHVTDDMIEAAAKVKYPGGHWARAVKKPDMKAWVVSQRAFIRDMLTAALAVAPRSLDPETVERWQPIETAPRDGTRIVLAKYVGHPDHISSLWWMTLSFWSSQWQNWNDGIEPSGLADPTHWMPLPTPPAATRSLSKTEG